MFTPVYTNRFKKDLELMLRRGKDKEKFKAITRNLINEVELERKHNDHKLLGHYKDRRECHIEADWLLIYRIDGNEIVFERTGSHSDLFK
ncbi:Addiction module toxin, RelE/StbE [Candidatus Magnetoovum chiemensis]|nr:Addiction module toxin, RelE/StbE [Candidatus Magnetoovum chiemensis]